MFSLFRPRCPIALQEQVWVERRLTWMADCFGIDRLLQSTPILDDQPDWTRVLSQPRLDLDELLQLCRQQLQVRRPVECHVSGSAEMGTALGLYQRGDESDRIFLSSEIMQDRAQVVATLAHELSHAVLLGEGRLDPDGEDMEPTTDLYCVFCGIAIFSANTSFYDRSWKDGIMEHTIIGKRGYLAAHVFGYAQAICCWRRGDTPAPLAALLRPDARVPFLRGVKYLSRQGETVFADQLPRWNAEEIASRWLRSTPLQRLDGLFRLVEVGGPIPVAAPAVQECLLDDDSAFRNIALQVVAAHPELVRPTTEGLLDVAVTRETVHRQSAWRLLEQAAADDNRIGQLAANMFTREPDLIVRGAIARCIARDARIGPAMLPEISHFIRAAVHSNGDGLSEGLTALLQISPCAENDLGILQSELNSPTEVALFDHGLLAARQAVADPTVLTAECASELNPAQTNIPAI